MPTRTELDTLARTIYGEARGEGEYGMQAVANVIMNRFDKFLSGEITWWGEGIIDICLKPKQFSCWNTGDPNLAVIEKVDATNQTFAIALNVAGKAIDGDLEDITNGATSYYADTSPEPYWAKGKTPCAHIGHHLFFEDEA